MHFSKTLLALTSLTLLVSCAGNGAKINPFSWDNTVAKSAPKTTSPKTVNGGESGSSCLAVDVLANNGAFIRRGTRGDLNNDIFVVNGVAHDLSGLPYSIKSC